jgi:hypothetical protein
MQILLMTNARARWGGVDGNHRPGPSSRLMSRFHPVLESAAGARVTRPQLRVGVASRFSAALIATVRAAASVFVVVFVVLATVAPAAWAAPASSKSQDVEARALYARGEYEKALQIFSTLFAEHGDPVYMRNIGRCHQMLRSPVRAIDAFREYLRRARNLSPAERTEVQGFIDEMEKLKQEQAAAQEPAPDKAAGAIDDPANSAEKPLPASAAQAPEATSPSLAVTAPQAPPESPSVFSRWWFWTGIGVAIAGGTAAAFALRTQRPECPAGTTCR